MSDLFNLDPTGRFSGRAEAYARYRPDYPDAAIDHIVAHCGLNAWSLIVDVGCGTGISSRIFAQRRLQVMGIEPNRDMRRQAEAEPFDGSPLPVYRRGQAEATGVPDASVELVLAAQAFHWFRADEALREFHRILKPGGWVALMWNERDESDPFTRAYGDGLRIGPDTAELEKQRAAAGAPLLTCPLFEQAGTARFHHEQTLNAEEVVGRARSASYFPRDPQIAARVTEALQAAFRRFERNGNVCMRYVTSVLSARKFGKSLRDAEA